MQTTEVVLKRIEKNIAVSFVIILLPILFMFVHFYLTRERPWQHGSAKPGLTFLDPTFLVLNSWGLPAIMLIIGLFEWLLGFYDKAWDHNEKILDVFSFLFPRIITNPLIAYFSLKILPHLFPSLMGTYSWIPFWWGFFIISVTIDLTEYWYHRLHHEFPFLWRFHRSHHTAAYMGMSVAFRTNYINQLFISQSYLIAGLIYLGLGNSLLLFISIRTIISVSAHSSIPWDKPLYQSRWLHPLAWILERTISTPATHHAHHAASDNDGIGNYNGNYGNVFFLWDVIFKTGVISRKYPPSYGIQDYKKEEWYAQYFWPILKSRKKGSELSYKGSLTNDDSVTSEVDLPIGNNAPRLK